MPTATRTRPRGRSRQHDHCEAERGSITVFAVMMTTVFVAVAGLLVDGGLALAGKAAAITDAQDAARTAETAIDTAGLRHGTVTLNTTDALTAAHTYLTAAGDTGIVQIHGTEVHIVARRTVHTQILRLLGIPSLTETGTANADLETGITHPHDLTTPHTGAGP